MLEEWRDDPLNPYQWIFSLAWTDANAYVELLSELRFGRGPLPDLDPTDTFWILEDHRLVGEIRVRYGVGERKGFFGNVGYSVRRCARGRGIATAALQLALGVVRDHGLTQALLTCAETNAASAGVIEKFAPRRLENVDHHADPTGAT